MDWFSKNNYRIVIRLPYSLQVLTVHSELYFLLFSFIHGGFSQPFGGLIRCSDFSFLPSFHFTGFLNHSCCILIDILIVWFQLGFDIILCSGKLMHLTTVPVCVTCFMLQICGLLDFWVIGFCGKTPFYPCHSDPSP